MAVYARTHDHGDDGGGFTVYSWVRPPVVDRFSVGAER